MFLSRSITISLLAVALAGCTGPADPRHATPGPSVRDGGNALLGGAPASLAARTAEADDLFLDGCPPLPQQSEETRAGEHIVRIAGCTLAHLPVDDPMGAQSKVTPRADIDVPARTANLTLLVHLHGPEAMDLTIIVPGNPAVEQRVQGGGSTDSFARFVFPSPPEGTWKVRSTMEDLLVERGWSITAVMAAEPAR